MSWSRHGYEKASYCISQTGRQPAMQSPTAEPRIPASASGVSTQRSGPKRSRRPAVARKTPPARPTSSPSTITSGSRSSSTWNASLIASTSVSSAIEHPPQLGEILVEGRGRRSQRVREEQRRVRRRLGLGLGDPIAHQLQRLRPYGLRGLVREQPEPPQVRLVAAEALALLFLLDPLRVDVGRGIVRRRVRGSAVGERLDEGRSLARARTRSEERRVGKECRSRW